MLKKSKGVIAMKVTVSSPLGEQEGVTARERERMEGDREGAHSILPWPPGVPLVIHQ